MLKQVKLHFIRRTTQNFVQNEYNYSKYCSFEYEILKNIERKKNRCYNYCTENFAYEGNCSNTLEIFLQ